MEKDQPWKLGKNKEEREQMIVMCA